MDHNFNPNEQQAHCSNDPRYGGGGDAPDPSSTPEPEECVQDQVVGYIVIPPAKLEKIRVDLWRLDEMEQQHPFHAVPDSTVARQMRKIHRGQAMEEYGRIRTLKPSPKWNRSLNRVFMRMCASPEFRKMLEQRVNLPAYHMQYRLLKALDASQVVVVTGATGCGKTTQVPQFILDEFMRTGNGSVCTVLCSQPRRMAAISVARRVAVERAERLGDSVGYQIRLEAQHTRDRASITFCTAGVLLKRLERNIFLSDVTHLILDEVHERDMMTDIILAILKMILPRAKHLKVILMSATMHAQRFTEYFENCATFDIPGFTHDVETFYLEDVLLKTGYMHPDDVVDLNNTATHAAVPFVWRLRESRLYPVSVLRALLHPDANEHNLEHILELLILLCKIEEAGAILVFLTGFSDIIKLREMMQESQVFLESEYVIYSLHSQIPANQQASVFDVPPEGVRKIVLSTNIAETSVTIEDVVFVIDCGRIKINDYDAKTNEEVLEAQWVSQANANQRRGRAGRVRRGKCYHMLTRGQFEELADYQKPELARIRLEGVVLMLKVMRVGNVRDFLRTCLDPPPEVNVNSAFSVLQTMNALTDTEELTPLGYHLASLPIAPQLGKLILMGALFGCVAPAINIACSLDYKDAFHVEAGEEWMCRESKIELAEGSNSDHILMHNVMSKYDAAKDRKKFCKDAYLKEEVVTQLRDMKQQFANILKRSRFIRTAQPDEPSVNINSRNHSLIKALVSASVFPNILFNTPERLGPYKFSTYHTMQNRKVDVHVKSVAAHRGLLDAPFVTYYRKVRTAGDFVYDVSDIHYMPLLLFGEPWQCFAKGNDICIQIYDHLIFITNQETADVILSLRDRFNRYLGRKLMNPQPTDYKNEMEVGVLAIITDLIAMEEDGSLFE